MWLMCSHSLTLPTRSFLAPVAQRCASASTPCSGVFPMVFHLWLLVCFLVMEIEVRNDLLCHYLDDVTPLLIQVNEYCIYFLLMQ